MDDSHRDVERQDGSASGQEEEHVEELMVDDAAVAAQEDDEYGIVDIDDVDGDGAIDMVAGPGDVADWVADDDMAEGEEEAGAGGDGHAADAVDVEADAAAADGSPGFVFPIARVKKIMRIDGDVKKVTVDAVRAVSAALELFLKQAVEGSGAVTLSSGHKQIHDGHFRIFATNHDEFDFLPDCLPPPGRMPKAVSSKPRASAVAAPSRPAAAAGGAAARRPNDAAQAEVPGAGAKQTVLTFSRQQEPQHRQVDIGSGDEGAQNMAEQVDA